MKKLISLLLITLSLSHATNQIASNSQVRMNMEKMSVEDFKKAYQDNFQILSDETVADIFNTESWNSQPSIETAKNALNNQDKEELFKIFSCPTTNEGYTALLHDIKFISGTMECLVYKSNNLYFPIGLAKKTITAWEGLLDLDVEKATTLQQANIAKAQIWADQFTAAQQDALAGTKGYINKLDIMLAAALGDGEIVDTEATINTGLLVINPEYSSIALSSTKEVEVSSKDTTFQEVKGFWNSLVYLMGQGVIDTTVIIEKQLLKMEQKITDNSNLLGSRNGNIFSAYHKFSEVSAAYYLSIAVFALIFGGSIWILNGINKDENGNKTMNFSKAYPASFVIGALLLFPVYNDGNLQSKFQKMEIHGYHLFLSWADGLAKLFTTLEFQKIQNELGMHSKNQLVNAQALKLQSSNLMFLHGVMADRCEAEGYGNIPLDKLGFYKSKNNYYGATEETLLRAVLNQDAGVDYYSTNYLPNGYTKTLAFCGKRYEQYYTHTARSEKFNKVLTGEQKLNAEQMAKLISLQYGMYNDWGIISVLSLPVIKYKLKNANILEKPSEDESNQDLIQKFANTAVVYLLPGSEKISHLVQSFLSPLENIPYIGTLISKGGGAILGTLIMQKIVTLLPIIAICIFGAFRVVIILLKIFIFHLITPILMLSILINKGQKHTIEFTTKILANMFELPLFVVVIYILFVAQDYLSGIGTSIAQSLNAIYLEAGITADEWEMLANIDFYFLGAAIDQAISIFELVLIYKIIFSLHTTILKSMQIEGEDTLEQLSESMVDNARTWSNKL